MELLFLLLAGCTFLQLFSVHAINLNEYLAEKLRQSKTEFIKIHIRKTAPVQEKSYRVHWDRSWRQHLTNEHQPFTINMFDGIFILDGDRVMTPSFNETPSNEPLREVYPIKDYLIYTIKFVRSIVWQGTPYLLVCYEPGLCSLHTGKQNNSLQFRHTIGDQENSVDAIFFAQSDQLYLVIANNADKCSVIFRWSGTYMDRIQKVMTIGATSVTAFEHRQSTIIVFAQSDVENPRINSQVYEFKDSDIARIQFLITAQPTSVHHYVHGDFNFVLMINESGPSSVLCWDGRELLDWFSFPEIDPHSLISIFHMGGDTFVVVAHDNIIQLYKFHSTYDWKSENIKYFQNGQKIIDMAVSMNECTMTVVLVIQEKDMYWVEEWEAEMTSVSSGSVVEDVNVRKYLSDLIEVLQARMPAIKEAEASWEFLLSSAQNLTIPQPVAFDNLILQSGTVESIEIATEEDVLPPHQIEKALGELDREIHNIETELSKWKKEEKATENIDGLNTMRDKIMVDEAYLEELEIDRVHVDFVNNVDIRHVNNIDVQLEKIVLPEDGQQSTHPWHVKNLIIQNLEVDSLCGIPAQYWALKNNGGIALAAANNSLEFSNDTIILHSDLTVPTLKIKSLNGTNVDELINDLFIINRTQTIKGSITYTKSLQVTNLTTQMLNGVPVDQLMTTITNQSFGDFYIKNLEIENLHAETIKGVPVEGAARKSRENVIKGKVKLANLHVIENFVIDVNASTMKIPEQFLQIYENVTILGDLYLENIVVDEKAALFVEDIQVNVSDMFDNFWTKSSDQTITGEIILEGGLTIDKLNTKYLNGFAESDFLYTTIEEIPSEFTNLRFENFHVDEFLSEDNNISFFEIVTDGLMIHKELRLQSLQASDIFTLAFNGINVDDIMNGVRGNISKIVELPAVQARRVFVDKLDVGLLNSREIILEDGLRIDDDHELAFLKIPEFHVRDLKVERLNGVGMNFLTRLKNLTLSDLNRIVIDGDLTVENLTVAQVDGQSTESFLEELARSDIVIMSEKSIESLVVQNITLESLYGQNFDNFVASALLKSSEQTISGHFSAHIITSENVTMNFINGRNSSQLMWVNEPLTITGNVTFSNLFVEGDVITSELNGRDVNELYDSLFFIPAKNIDLLKVNEGLYWNTSLTSPTSISYLMKNAVTKDSDQVITGNVTFAKGVHAWAVTGTFDEINQIRSIMSDAVIDCGEPIEISGKKFFKDDFVADSLTVNGDLGIIKINDVDILKFNNSVVRQDSEDTITGPLTFLKDVTVEKLRVNNADLNASIDAAVRFDDVMPSNIFFEDLAVLLDVHLDNLDGINFDEFANNRVTLSEDHDISCNMKFNGVVTVTGNADVGKINRIRPSEFVLNDVNETQIIYGVKTFEKDLIVEGDVTAPQINNIDILKEYNNSIQNYEDVDIFGNLTFKANVRIQNMSISGLVNDVNLQYAVGDLKEKVNETLQNLDERWKEIDKNIEYSTRVSKTLPNVFLYLEAERYLNISGSNISKVDVVYYNNSTIRLNMYSELSGKFCWLSDECQCVNQYVVQLTYRDVLVWRKNLGEIVKNFYNSDDNFGVDVISNTISSNEKCTQNIETEFTQIILRESKETEILERVSDKIEGYVKDAEVFKYNGDVYIVLAIHYDKARATHRTNSLLYKTNTVARNVTLVQQIPTDGAWSLQIFKIDNHEVFVLIGCFDKISRSLLYRFDSVAQKLELVRAFASRSRYVKSLSQGKDHFILLDNPDMHAVNIYKYDPTSRDFYNYQDIFHVHPINGIECFYTDDFGNSDVFVIVTTEGGRFYIYEYMFAGKFQMRLQHTVDGLRTMMPFYYMNRHYIFAGTYANNVIFRIIKQGPQDKVN